MHPNDGAHHPEHFDVNPDDFRGEDSEEPKPLLDDRHILLALVVETLCGCALATTFAATRHIAHWVWAWLALATVVMSVAYIADIRWLLRRFTPRERWTYAGKTLALYLCANLAAGCGGALPKYAALFVLLGALGGFVLGFSTTATWFVYQKERSLPTEPDAQSAH